MTKEDAKHLSNVLKAYAKGERIEIKVGNEWITIEEGVEPNFMDNPYEYRVKHPIKNIDIVDIASNYWYNRFTPLLGEDIAMKVVTDFRNYLKNENRNID